MSSIERVSNFVEWLVETLAAEFNGDAEIHVGEGALLSGSQVVVGDVTVTAGDERAGTRRRPFVLTADLLVFAVDSGGSPAEARTLAASIGARVESTLNVAGARSGGGVCDMSAVLDSLGPFATNDGRGVAAPYSVTAMFRE